MKPKLDGTIVAAAVTLTFDFLAPKCNQHTYEPKYICDRNCVKFPLLVFEIWCWRSFWTHGL